MRPQPDVYALAPVLARHFAPYLAGGEGARNFVAEVHVAWRERRGAGEAEAHLRICTDTPGRDGPAGEARGLARRSRRGGRDKATQAGSRTCWHAGSRD